MNFQLTDERRMLQETLQRFLQDKYNHESRRALLAAGEAYDTELFGELADLGVLAALFDETAGGFGGAGFDIAVVFEELGRFGVIEPVLSVLLAGGLLADATDSTGVGHSVHQDLCWQILSVGGSLIALAHSEPESRYDLSQVTVSARCDGDDIILNGVKTHVINGAQADYWLVSAREVSGADTDDEIGISLFLLPADSGGCAMHRPHMNIDGTDCSNANTG